MSTRLRHCKWGIPSTSSAQGGAFEVGRIKKGKRTKWMVVVDGQGIPLGNHIDSATSAEVTLVYKTRGNIRVHNGRKGRPKTRPKRLVADKGYDSDPLRQSLGKRGIELISPYRKNRKSVKAFRQATRERYRRRYKVERTLAWISSFRRLTVRYDHSLTIYRSFFHLACIIIRLRRL